MHTLCLFKKTSASLCQISGSAKWLLGGGLAVKSNQRIVIHSGGLAIPYIKYYVIDEHVSGTWCVF